jgi:hypothetical protein
VPYRCAATSVEGFVQQIACCYLRHGYWWYVTGWIPPGKDPESVDAKLIEKYGIGVSESTRSRRKRLGYANLQYIRYGRLFVILATEGGHHFKVEEGDSLRDIRKAPIKFEGYSISCRRGGWTEKGETAGRWHSHVEIERETYKELRDYFLYLAAHRSAENLALAFYRIPFEGYAPVRRQVLNIFRAANRVRKTAGYQVLPKDVLPLRRRVVKPFGAGGGRGISERITRKVVPGRNLRGGGRKRAGWRGLE